MKDVFIIDAIRTPIGKYGGALSTVRPDDLLAIVIHALMQRNNSIDMNEVEEVIAGAANQAGEDNRNVARMAALLAGLPVSVGGVTVNRLCASGMQSIMDAARAIMCGDGEIYFAGGVESMSRAPFVLGKAEVPFSRSAKLEDTTIGWRFVNPAMKEKYGTDSMPETAENVAEEWKISRQDQDAFAFRSQQRTATAMRNGQLAEEIIPVAISGTSKTIVSQDEHPRPQTTLEALTKLKPIVKPTGTITAGNSSGVNDGAAAILLASEDAAAAHGLNPIARVVGSSTAGVPPRVMGIGPVPATRRLLAKTGLKHSQLDVIELNEAFAAQSLAVLRDLGLPDDADHVNPNGGAIAIGHPLGASGARLVIAAANQLRRRKARYALCTMCIGVGQGIATVLERV